MGWSTATPTGDVEGAHHELRRGIAYFMARGGELHARRFARLGLGAERRAVRDAWDRGGSAAGVAAVPAELAREFAYAGSVDGAEEWLDAKLEAGFTIVPVAVEEPDPRRRSEILQRLVG